MKKIVDYVLILAIITILLLYVVNHWLFPYVDALPTSIGKIFIKSVSVWITPLAILLCSLFLVRKDQNNKRKVYLRRCLLFYIVAFVVTCFMRFLAFYFFPVLNDVKVGVATCVTLAVVICYILYKLRKF